MTQTTWDTHLRNVELEHENQELRKRVEALSRKVRAEQRTAYRARSRADLWRNRALRDQR